MVALRRNFLKKHLSNSDKYGIVSDQSSSITDGRDRLFMRINKSFHVPNKIPSLPWLRKVPVLGVPELSEVVGTDRYQEYRHRVVKVVSRCFETEGLGNRDVAKEHQCVVYSQTKANIWIRHDPAHSRHNLGWVLCRFSLRRSNATSRCFEIQDRGSWKNSK